MRTLVILRGVSGSGKSRFVKEQGLEEYTISSDQIRLQYSSPTLDDNGDMVISQKHDKKVWAHLFDLLSFRMSQGEFTVVDATNLDARTLNRYKQLKKQYGYKVVMVDFFVTLKEAIESNEERFGTANYVPVSVIRKQYNRYIKAELPYGLVDEYCFPNEGTNLKKELDNKLWVDLNSYKKIHHIGDIHGCRDSLLTYLIGGKLNSDEFYIFVGDYTDRGIQNVETVSYLTSIRNEPNVVFLEGNHDKRLIRFSKGRTSYSDETSQFKSTKAELILAIKEGRLDLGELRDWTLTFKEAFFYEYEGTKFIISHGGISSPVTNEIGAPVFLTGLSSEEFIEGTGDRDFDVDYAFSQQAQLFIDSMGERLGSEGFSVDNTVQVHGHRNKFKVAIDQYYHSYNLEGRVEFGEYLRVLTVQKNLGNIQFDSHYVANKIFEPEVPRENKEKIESANIVGFNGEDTIVRGYGKLKEIGFDKGAHLTKLAGELSFPVIGYQAYDGDIVYMFMSTDGLTVKAYSKNNRGEVQEKFLELMNFNFAQTEYLKDFIKEKNVTLVFTVLDNSFDRITNYATSKVILLDAIKNEDTATLGKISDMEVQGFAQEFSGLGRELQYKQISFITKNWTEFLSLYRAIKDDKNTLNGKGFIIEDTNSRVYLIKNNAYRMIELIRERGADYNFDSNDFVDVSNNALQYLEFNLESSKALDKNRKL